MPVKRVVGVVAGVAMLVAGLVGPEGAQAAPRRGITWEPCSQPDRAGVTGAISAVTAAGTSSAVGSLGSLGSLGSVGSLRAVGVVIGRVASPPARIAKTPAPVGMECATLRVPLDYDEPDGQQISLALNRVRGSASRDGDHLGSLLVNPGGPGGSGLGLAAYVASKLPKDVAARYDVIGFAPRGVAPSTPSLSCVDPRRFYAPPRPDSVPRGQADESVLISRAREYAEGCGNRWSWFLPYLTTENNARDMDSIRAALGEDKISYLGYSYGTYMGAVYATLFPQRVRRLVLDSVVDPDGVWYDANIAQDYSFDKRHKDFLDWVARHDDVYRLGRTERAVSYAWYSMRSRLRTLPAEQIVGPSELDDIYSAGGYSNRLWPDLAAAFSAYVLKGETAGLVKLFHGQAEIDPSEENSYAVYLGVECRDAAWPRSWARWHADTVKVNAAAPFMAWSNAVYNAPCAFWPVRGGTPVKIGAADLPPVLMIQAVHDAATPYAGALRMARRFPTARLVTEGGGNHGVSLAGNACVDRQLAAYLRDGTPLSARGADSSSSGASRGVRDADAVCAAMPQPQPALPAGSGPARP
jgi:pimeloyl-ACP methyl ester carboxylesterase